MTNPRGVQSEGAGARGAAAAAAQTRVGAGPRRRAPERRGRASSAEVWGCLGGHGRGAPPAGGAGPSGSRARATPGRGRRGGDTPALPNHMGAGLHRGSRARHHIEQSMQRQGARAGADSKAGRAGRPRDCSHLRLMGLALLRAGERGETSTALHQLASGGPARRGAGPAGGRRRPLQSSQEVSMNRPPGAHASRGPHAPRRDCGRTHTRLCAHALPGPAVAMRPRPLGARRTARTAPAASHVRNRVIAVRAKVSPLDLAAAVDVAAHLHAGLEPESNGRPRGREWRGGVSMGGGRQACRLCPAARARFKAGRRQSRSLSANPPFAPPTHARALPAPCPPPHPALPQPPPPPKGGHAPWPSTRASPRPARPSRR
jgi:hypothetical protein